MAVTLQCVFEVLEFSVSELELGNWVRSGQDSGSYCVVGRNHLGPGSNSDAYVTA